MATLSKDECSALAMFAGLPMITAGWMGHVAICESGGRTDAVNRNTNGTVDVGLWQINSVHRKAHPDWTESWLKDPQNNAKAMKTLFEAAGNKPTPWSSSQKCWEPKISSSDPVNGITDFLSGKVSDVAGGLSGAAGAALDPLSAIGDLVQTVGGFFEWMTDPTTWKRVALVLAGGGIILVGVAALARGTEVGDAVESLATQAATKGAVK